MATVYELLIAEKESCERIARRYQRDIDAEGPNGIITKHIAHYAETAKALEIAAKNLPVEVAEQEI